MIERAIPILCKAVKDRSSNTSDKDVVDCLEALAKEAAVHGRPSSPAPEPAQGEVPQPGHAELMMSSDCDIRPRCTVGCRWSRSSIRRRATSHPFVLHKNKEEKPAHRNFSRCMFREPCNFRICADVWPWSLGPAGLKVLAPRSAELLRAYRHRVDVSGIERKAGQTKRPRQSRPPGRRGEANRIFG
jgi:hypothetical protein